MYEYRSFQKFNKLMRKNNWGVDTNSENVMVQGKKDDLNPSILHWHVITLYNLFVW